MKQIPLFLILILSFQVLAQEKPVALKVDEFVRGEQKDDWGKTISEEFRLKRFASELKKHPKMKAVIIGYDSRKQVYGGNSNGDDQILSVQRELEQSGISENRIVRVVGGVRENVSFEFWLLPEGAEIPQPIPHFQNSEIFHCPDIYISEDGQGLENSPRELSPSFYKLPPSTNLRYKWIVSKGKIISGETSEKLLLDLSQVSESQVAIKLTVEGLHPECNNQAVRNIRVISFPFKWEEFDSYNENFKIRLPLLQDLLEKNPNLEAKLFYYPSRIDPVRSGLIATQVMNRGIAFMKFPREKMIVEFGGYRDQIRYEIWLYPKGTEPPKPTPTVDPKFIQTPKAKKKSTRRS